MKEKSTLKDVANNYLTHTFTLKVLLFCLDYYTIEKNLTMGESLLWKKNSIT